MLGLVSWLTSALSENLIRHTTTNSRWLHLFAPNSSLYIVCIYYYIKYIYASIIERLVMNYITLETYKVAIFYVCIVQIPYKHN